uniref:Ribonuclease H protein At1g65750 family n=1 Tax=Cajanus cajan TaxID=3821 RepID=A0A151SVE8_CAJCA|nr:Putative ribonuclease H protein At1g65750 family [Cajanus cajan]
MLNRLGFCEKWRGWIQECLTSAEVSVLVNGSPTSEFRTQRGIRQGDPLAPFLFVVVAEGLAGPMRSAMSKGLFLGYRVGQHRVLVNLLQYADDTIFFGEPSMENVLTIKCILRCYELISGLKVNFHKSNFRILGSSEIQVLRFAVVLNCKILHFPFRYLGIPIGDNPRKSTMWRPILDKIINKLAPWKDKLISMAGRVCIINFVLTALPLYFIPFFKMPKKVVNNIIKIQRAYLWGGEEDSRKVAWVSWDKICRPKQNGGLGIKNIKLFNESLLGKWRWNLFHQQGKLWANILKSKYGGWEILGGAEDGHNESIWWRDLKKICGGGAESSWFARSLRWRLGKGEKIRF